MKVARKADWQREYGLRQMRQLFKDRPPIGLFQSFDNDWNEVGEGDSIFQWPSTDLPAMT